MLQHPVQATVQPIFFGHREVGLQQLIPGAVHEPLPVQAKLAARIEQAIHHQQPQHFLPTHRQRIGRNFPVVREQAHGGVALFVLVEDVQSLAPCGLLLVVDLAQVQHGPLYRLATQQAPVFDDAEAAAVLAVLVAIGAAQKHRKQQHARNPTA
jgi:hypothetical protein